MSVNETAVEVVKFQADGLTEIAAQTKALAAEIDGANAKLGATAALIASPAYHAHARDLARVGDAQERLAREDRNRRLAQRLADGSAVRQQRSLARLDARHAAGAAQVRNQALAADLDDGSAARRIREAEQLARAHERTSAAARNAATRQQLDDGSLRRDTRDRAALDREHERMQRLAAPKGGRAFLEDIRGARGQQQKLERGIQDGSYVLLQKRRQELEKTTMLARNAALAAGLADGSEARRVRSAQALNAEYEKLQRRAELVANYGERLGGFLARGDKVFGAAGRLGGYAMTAAVATGGGLVRSGFSNTVESNRMGLETKMLGRELAGAFKPVIDVATRVTRSVRKFMEGLDSTGQNVVMFGGLALSAAATLRLITGGGIMGSMARGALGLSGGGLLGRAGPSLAANAAGSAVGSAAGRAGGSAIAGGAAARGAGSWKAGAARAGAAGIAAYSAIEGGSGGYYTEMRARGHNKFEAAIAAGGGGFIDLISQGTRALGFHEKTYGEAFRAQMGSGQNGFATAEQLADFKRRGEDRRAVAIAGGGFDEAGSGYDRLNTAISMVEAERERTDSVTSVMEPIMTEIRDILRRTEEANRVRSSPPLPRPGGAS